ncbi:hypothetical protein B0I35DRAFT_423030 [Stachybotrys elegans]|uniref:Uncharacterized protein n=1 Tax=Stachybotrys elegans TaxID=80388 RepID=A0A8K0SZY1_9HYPO|nr:hypothetical protein B0I35DRAFT_423030 [Stachybotrys elegans]
MPALTINTDAVTRPRSPSPVRPPVSPITPTLPPARLHGDQAPRQPLTHSQPDQVAIPPPAPIPMEFDSNPDVIALKSAISILQMQRQRATADIQTLSRTKEDALRDPEAFIKDLAGKQAASTSKPTPKDNDEDEEENEGHSTSANNQWPSLPKPQDVVRCPPINWSQYAIVGDSLDKLHAEQVANPSQGTPATIGPHGTYEFKGDGKQERYTGIAAPYDPSKDRLDKKQKTKK